jgi:branched-chain amino acid transport system substrate-binding protein
VIVSDLPLRSAPEAPTIQMSQAIAFVLRDHGYRAGRLRIGYRSCDDSTAQRRIFDPDKCASNAGAYLRDRSVLGVVGPYNSGCAGEVLAAAGGRGGPLPVVGPTTSDPALTRDTTTVPPSALAAIRRGRQGFARVTPRDDQLAAAGASLARRLGARRVFIATDGQAWYGGPLAGWYRRAARRLGLEVAGEERWGTGRRAREALARHVRGSGAEAVLLAGLLDTGGGEVLATLHRRLGPRVRLIAPDGFLPISSLFVRAGNSAARAAWVLRLGVPEERLTARGRRFVAEFGATQPQRHVDQAAVYAAVATEVLLDAIARSDGTRRSVVAQLRDDRVRDGLIGRFRLDSHGDVVPGPVTVVRPVEPGGSSRIQSIDGARIDSVIEPPDRLTR